VAYDALVAVPGLQIGMLVEKSATSASTALASLFDSILVSSSWICQSSSICMASKI
jgi:hypothetical protein